MAFLTPVSVTFLTLGLRPVLLQINTPRNTISSAARWDALDEMRKERGGLMRVSTKCHSSRSDACRTRIKQHAHAYTHAMHNPIIFFHTAEDVLTFSLLSLAFPIVALRSISRSLCRCLPFFTTSTPTWLRRIRRFALTSAGATLASRRTPPFPTRPALSPLRTASCRMNSTLFSTPCPRLSPPRRWVAGAWTTNNCQSVSDVYKIRQ